MSIQVFFSILLDTFLLSTLPISLNLGVNGIAITNIIVNCILLLIATMLLKRENIFIFQKGKLEFRWLKEWFNIGKFSGLESLLRNLVFSIMVLRMVNLVAEQGNYWIANNFIWQWLLLPTLALADLVKQEIAENKENIQNKTFGYLMLVSIFAILWLLSIPFWKAFFQYILHAQDYTTVYQIVLLESIFYLTFLFNNCIFDSTFYALGKRNYLLIQSICIDGIYYAIVFIFYLSGIFIPTLYRICLMFGIGMALDFLPALALYLHLLKKNAIKIYFRQ